MSATESSVTRFTFNQKRIEPLPPLVIAPRPPIDICRCSRRCSSGRCSYIVPLLLLTGCRKRELLEARWEDFDLEQRRWRIPLSKSGKARHVPLSDRVLRVLAQVVRRDA